MVNKFLKIKKMNLIDASINVNIFINLTNYNTNVKMVHKLNKL